MQSKMHLYYDQQTNTNEKRTAKTRFETDEKAGLKFTEIYCYWVGLKSDLLK